MGLSLKNQPDNHQSFIYRGDLYALFVNNGICMIWADVENITSKYTAIYTTMGVVDTARFPIPLPPSTASSDPWVIGQSAASALAEAGDGEQQFTGPAMKIPSVMYPDVQLINWHTMSGVYQVATTWS
ncbi:MAG: hypothetical protein ACKPKO_63200, partial [Candidatus Fonsibacter sp.]